MRSAWPDSASGSEPRKPSVAPSPAISGRALARAHDEAFFALNHDTQRKCAIKTPQDRF